MYGNFGSITPPGQEVFIDLSPGDNCPVDMASDTVTINNFIGNVPGKTSGTVKFTRSGAGEGTMSGNIQLIEGANVINITGSLTVKNGSTITITIS